MATIRRRGAKWQAQVRRAGHRPQSRSFTRKQDAERWSRQMEGELDRGGPDTPDMTFSNLLMRYQAEVTSRKRGIKSEASRINAMRRDPIAQVKLSRLSPKLIADYRDRRLQSVASPTVLRELVILHHCLETARKDWGLVRENPASAISRPTHGKSRTRRLLEPEHGVLDRELKACRNCNVRRIFQFALETAMRRGELLAFRWLDVNFEKKTVHLRMTKNGEPRFVPLSPVAVELLLKWKHDAERFDNFLDSAPVFPITENAFRLAWERAVSRSGIADLRFHDLRHESISRFFERGLSVPEVALISGHKDVRMLFRYTHLRAEDVARKLAGK